MSAENKCEPEYCPDYGDTCEKCSLNPCNQQDENNHGVKIQCPDCGGRIKPKGACEWTKQGFLDVTIMQCDTCDRVFEEEEIRRRCGL